MVFFKESASQRSEKTFSPFEAAWNAALPFYDQRNLAKHTTCQKQPSAC
jgi:hypothetical protein